MARIGVQGDTAWWVHRTLADAGTVEDGVFETEYATLGPLVSLDPAPERPGRAARARRAARRGARRAAAAPRAAQGRPRPRPARERRAEPRPARRAPAGRAGRARAVRRPPGAPRAPPRRRAATSRSADLDADELAERFSIPREELQEHLSLLNLVNFGGGCYTVYAEVDDDETGVSASTRSCTATSSARPPKLTPLEARAIRLAIEYVGPTIAADARHAARPRAHASSRRRSASSSWRQHAATRAGDDEEALVRTLVRRRREAPPRRARVPEGGRGGADDAARRAVHDRARAARSGASTRGTARSTGRAPTGSTGCARRGSTRERFEPREGFDPNYLSEPAVAHALARAADRALEARARRTGADRQVGRRRT